MVELSFAELEPRDRSEEHTSELQSPSVISYAVFCLKKKNQPVGAAPVSAVASCVNLPSAVDAVSAPRLVVRRLSFFFLMDAPPPRPTQLRTLFPYTTLFRSGRLRRPVVGRRRPRRRREAPDRGADRKSTRLNSSHPQLSRMPSSA